MCDSPVLWWCWFTGVRIYYFVCLYWESHYKKNLFSRCILSVVLFVVKWNDGVGNLCMWSEFIWLRCDYAWAISATVQPLRSLLPYFIWSKTIYFIVLSLKTPSETPERLTLWNETWNVLPTCCTPTLVGQSVLTANDYKNAYWYALKWNAKLPYDTKCSTSYIKTNSTSYAVGCMFSLNRNLFPLF